MLFCSLANFCLVLLFLSWCCALPLQTEQSVCCWSRRASASSADGGTVPSEMDSWHWKMKHGRSLLAMWLSGTSLQKSVSLVLNKFVGVRFPCLLLSVSCLHPGLWLPALTASCLLKIKLLQCLCIPACLDLLLWLG